MSDNTIELPDDTDVISLGPPVDETQLTQRQKIIRKYRGNDKLTTPMLEKMEKGLSKNMPPVLAAQYAGIHHDTFRVWMHAGEAIFTENWDSVHLPVFYDRYPNESDPSWARRLRLFEKNIQKLGAFYIMVKQAQGIALYELSERMWKRAMKEAKMFANAWMLERTQPEHYSLVTQVRQKTEVTAEIKHTHKLDSFQQLINILAPKETTPQLPAGPPTITLPEESVTRASDEG